MLRVLFIFIFCLFLVIPSTILAQQVGIGTDNPDASAALDVKATDKGAVFPRVSLVNVTNGVTPVNGPTVGLLVYNTNTSVTGGDGEGYYYWDGSKWVKFLTSATRVVESYAVNATRTYINSTSFIQVTGLSLTATLTGNAMVIIATSGSSIWRQLLLQMEDPDVLYRYFKMGLLWQMLFRQLILMTLYL